MGTFACSDSKASWFTIVRNGGKSLEPHDLSQDAGAAPSSLDLSSGGLGGLVGVGAGSWW